IFPFCLEHQIGVIVRGPLVMGILAGKFTGDETEADFPGDDFRKNWLTDPEQNAQFKADLAAVENLRPLVESDANPSLAQLALRFVIDHPAVSTVIPGARTATQAQSNSAVGQMPPLTAEEYAAIDAIVPPGGGRKIWPA
ncbi:MAG: aldo/keto reductase, partial [Planctomycetota bacterium]